MRQLDQQFGVPEALNRVEADPTQPNPWVQRLRNATKLAAAGILAATLSSCAADETDDYQVDTPTESAETAQKNPRLALTTFNGNYTVFSMFLENAKDLHVEFTVSRKENPEETFIVSTSGEAKGPNEVTMVDVFFNNPVEEAVVITKAVNLDTGEEMPLENQDPVSEGAIKGANEWPVPQE